MRTHQPPHRREQETHQWPEEGRSGFFVLPKTILDAMQRDAIDDFLLRHLGLAAQGDDVHGVTALVSAIGADAGSRLLYNRTKGEVEASIGALDYPSYTVVRPGLIGGQRQEFRAMERLSDAVLTLLGPVLPRAWRISPAENIASALIEAAVTAAPGRHIVSAAALA